MKNIDKTHITEEAIKKDFLDKKDALNNIKKAKKLLLIKSMIEKVLRFLIANKLYTKFLNLQINHRALSFISENYPSKKEYIFSLLLSGDLYMNPYKFADTIGIKVSEEVLDYSINGAFIRGGKIILINKLLSRLERKNVLIHEIGHVLLGHIPLVSCQS